MVHAVAAPVSLAPAAVHLKRDLLLVHAAAAGLAQVAVRQQGGTVVLTLQRCSCSGRAGLHGKRGGGRLRASWGAGSVGGACNQGGGIGKVSSKQTRCIRVDEYGYATLR